MRVHERDLCRCRFESSETIVECVCVRMSVCPCVIELARPTSLRTKPKLRLPLVGLSLEVVCTRQWARLKLSLLSLLLFMLSLLLLLLLSFFFSLSFLSLLKARVAVQTLRCAHMNVPKTFSYLRRARNHNHHHHNHNHHHARRPRPRDCCARRRRRPSERANCPA